MISKSSISLEQYLYCETRHASKTNVIYVTYA